MCIRHQCRKTTVLSCCLKNEQHLSYAVPLCWVLCFIYNYAECHYAECRVLLIIMLNVIMLNGIMLSVIMLNVNMLSVIMLSDAECRYAECNCAECRRTYKCPFKCYFSQTRRTLTETDCFGKKWMSTLSSPIYLKLAVSCLCYDSTGCSIKLFTVVINSVMYQAKAFVTVSYLQCNLTFAGILGAHHQR